MQQKRIQYRSSDIPFYKRQALNVRPREVCENRDDEIRVVDRHREIARDAYRLGGPRSVAGTAFLGTGTMKREKRENDKANQPFHTRRDLHG
jgi:hypothetical protein